MRLAPQCGGVSVASHGLVDGQLGNVEIERTRDDGIRDRIPLTASQQGFPTMTLASRNRNTLRRYPRSATWAMRVSSSGPDHPGVSRAVRNFALRLAVG